MEHTKSLPHVAGMCTAAGLMTFRAVAEYLAVPLSVVEALANERAIRVLRIGTERRVRREDLEDFLRRAEE